MRVLVAVLLLLLSAACQQATAPTEFDPSLGPVASGRMLSSDRSSYSPGASAVIRLRNTTSGPLGYNLCHTTLERSVGTDWRRVDEDRVCTMELRILQAGATATYEHRLPANLTAGEYRYRTQVEREGAQRMESAVSNTFTVGR